MSKKTIEIPAHIASIVRHSATGFAPKHFCSGSVWANGNMRSLSEAPADVVMARACGVYRVDLVTDEDGKPALKESDESVEFRTWARRAKISGMLAAGGHDVEAGLKEFDSAQAEFRKVIRTAAAAAVGRMEAGTLVVNVNPVKGKYIAVHSRVDNSSAIAAKAIATIDRWVAGE